MVRTTKDETGGAAPADTVEGGAVEGGAVEGGAAVEAVDAKPDEVVRALLAITDAELAAGPERRHVLDAALELALLEPAAADLAATRAEAVAEHASLTRALTSFPFQRGTAGTGLALRAADTFLERRLEALDLAAGLVAQAREVPGQR